MDNDNLLQLEGAIESVVFRNDENGYTVIELADGDDYLTAVGIMPQVSSGDVVKLTGKYTNHPLRQTVCRADLRNQQTYRGG